MILHKIQCSFRQHVYLLTRAAVKQKVRRQGEWIFSQHATVPGAYVQSEEAKDWITSVLREIPKFQSAKMQELFVVVQNNGPQRLSHPDTKLSLCSFSK